MWRRSFVVFACLIALACGGDAPATPPVPVVSSISVVLPVTSVTQGTEVDAKATALDAGGAGVPVQGIAWSTSSSAIATVTSTGVVTALAPGQVDVIATVDGISGAAPLRVTAPIDQCTGVSPIQLAVGQVDSISSAQASLLCIGSLTDESEYVLVPFNGSVNATVQDSVALTATNTSAITSSLNLAASRSPVSVGSNIQLASLAADASRREAGELEFRSREQRDIGTSRSRALVARTAHTLARKQIGNAAPTPDVGSIVQLNANLSGDDCNAPPQVHAARVVAVLRSTIVFADTLAPSGGYTDAELTAFGAAFDTVGFALDTLNFGAPTDIDNNGRVGIFFTPGVNAIPQPSGGYIGGLFANRDLYDVSARGCAGSNTGEMFYLPVPDPTASINASYQSKTTLSNVVLSTLVHEFQHLINEGRRLYVNNAPVDEEVWLNEGLSHIAEELLYYRESGRAPGQNLALQDIRENSVTVAQANEYLLGNVERLASYLESPSLHSPYSTDDSFEMRGAVWELLRYAADQKAGSGRSVWFPLVNSRTAGVANFDAVFGDIAAVTRNWSVAQFTDDSNLPVVVQYTEPSWNFRSIIPPLLTSQTFPLATSALTSSTPLTLWLVGGGAAYVRFAVGPGRIASVVATASSGGVAPEVEFMLVRTQ
ncbi:MAG TPA: Ig-like domain-containing protein [Gemmatimonadaceae bacterium]|jgi:hypothetical protein